MAIGTLLPLSINVLVTSGFLLSIINQKFSPSFLSSMHFFQNQFNAHIKCFQFDDGEEYRSKVFIDFLESQGIVHQFSCPYTLQ